MHSRESRKRVPAVALIYLVIASALGAILIASPPNVEGTQSYAAPFYLNNLSQGASGGTRQLVSFVGSSDPVGSIKVGIITGNYPVPPAAAASVVTGTPSQIMQNGRGYITVGQSPVGTIAAGTWLFNMTLQDTRAAGAAYIWITVFSCNQQDIARASPASPTCTFLLKSYDNSTNIKATQAPTPYTFAKPSVPQFNNVQVLYIEFWIHYTVDGGDLGDTITINTGFGNNVAGAENDGASVKTPSATYWLNTPNTACSNTCAVLSTSTGSASATTIVTIGTTPGKYLVRPTVTSTTTGTPRFQTGVVSSAGWEILDNGFLGTNIASGTWTFTVKLAASTIAGTSPSANLWISVFSCNVPNLGQGQIIISTSGQTGQTCRPVVKDWDNSTNFLTTTSAQTLTYTATGSAFSNAQYLYVETWISYTSATSSSAQITFTVQDASTSVAVPGGSTYYTTAQVNSCLNSCQELFYYDGVQSLATTDNIATNTGKYQVRPLVAGTNARGNPSVSTPSGYAWITEGAINGTIRSGVWQFVTSLTDSATGGAASLWFTVWNCARQNVGQAGAGCVLLFKNWDNSTNIKSNGFGTFTLRTSAEPAFTKVKYLAIEIWISETATSGSSPDTVTLHLGNSESFVELPGSENQFYYGTNAMTCAIGCVTLSGTTGAANSATKVTVGTTLNVYQVRPYATSNAASAPTQQTTIGAGWETPTPLTLNVTSGTWRFNVTVADAVSQAGMASLWLKVYSCATSLAGSPSTTGNCVFLFKNYDNTTNIKSSSTAAKYTYVTPTLPLFHNVQYLYVEYWVDYTVSSGASGDQLAFTTISAASSVETPPTSAASPTGLQIDSGKMLVSSTGTQQLRVSTSIKSSLLYLSISYATNNIGFVFVSDNSNLTWTFRSEEVGSSDIMMVFYSVAGPLLQGDVVTVGSGIAAQTAMSITVFSGEDASSPFDSSGSNVAATQTSFVTPTCTAARCTLPFASNVAQNNLLVAAMAYSVASASCNIFSTPTDSLGSSLAIEQTSSVTSGSNCYESVIIAGYAGGTGSDTITINFNGGAAPANQRGEIFELIGVSTNLDGASTGSGTGTAVSTSGSVSYNTNDFLVATFAGSATVTTLTAGVGFTMCAANFRSDCEYQMALSSGSTNFPFTVAPSMTWSEAAVAFQAAQSSRPSLTAATNTSPNTQISTTNPHDIVIGVVDARTAVTPTAGAGYTLLATPVVAPAGITMATEYRVLTTVQTNLAVGFGLSSSVAWIQLGDAVKAALSVIQPIVLTVIPLGVPITNFTVSGCGMTTTTIPGDGAPHSVTTVEPCVLTVTAASSPPNTRYMFSNAGAVSATWSVTVCTSGTCPAAANSYYYQLQNAFQAIPINPAAWDASFGIPVTGFEVGVAGQAVCTIMTSSGGGTAGCLGFADYNTQVTVTSPVALSGTEQWIQSGGNTFTDTTGGNTHVVSYKDQFRVSFRVVPGGAGNTNPSGINLWLDFGSTPISATANAGSAFSSWSATGPISITSPSSPSTNATISGSGTITAWFTTLVSDSRPFSETPRETVLLPRPGSDSFAFLASGAKNVILSRALSASFAFSAAASRLLTLIRPIGVSFVFSDLPSWRVTLGRAASDALPFTALASRTSAFVRALGDHFLTAENVLRSLALTGHVSDNFVFAENALRGLALTGRVSDPFVFAENVGAGLSFLRNAAESALFADLPAAMSGISRGVQDVFTTTDNAVRLLQRMVQVFDVFSFSDRLGSSRHIPARIFVIVRDSFQFFERAVSAVSLPRGILDTSSWTDAGARLLNLLRSLSAQFPFGEVASRSSSLFVAVEDAIKALENALSSVVQSTTSAQSNSTSGGNPSGANLLVFILLLLFLLLLALLVFLVYVRRKRKERGESPVASAIPSSP